MGVVYGLGKRACTYRFNPLGRGVGIGGRENYAKVHTFGNSFNPLGRGVGIGGFADIVLAGCWSMVSIRLDAA